MLLTWCWAPKLLSRPRSRWKPHPDKTLHKFNSFHSLWAELQSTRPVSRNSNALNCFSIFRERDKTFLQVVTRISNVDLLSTLNISQSYFCVARLTHDSNSLAQVVPPFACVSLPGFHAVIFFRGFLSRQGLFGVVHKKDVCYLRPKILYCWLNRELCNFA